MNPVPGHYRLKEERLKRDPLNDPRLAEGYLRERYLFQWHWFLAARAKSEGGASVRWDIRYGNIIQFIKSNQRMSNRNNCYSHWSRSRYSPQFPFPSLSPSVLTGWGGVMSVCRWSRDTPRTPGGTSSAVCAAPWWATRGTSAGPRTAPPSTDTTTSWGEGRGSHREVLQGGGGGGRSKGEGPPLPLIWSCIILIRFPSSSKTYNNKWII